MNDADFDTSRSYASAPSTAVQFAVKPAEPTDVAASACGVPSAVVTVSTAACEVWLPAAFTTRTA